MYIRFYDIDYFKVDVLSEKMKAGIREAESILKEQMEEFCNWYRCLDVIPRIGKIKEEVATDLDLRLYKILHQLPMEVFEKETLEKQIHRAAQKVTNKMLFTAGTDQRCSISGVHRWTGRDLCVPGFKCV